MSTITEAEFAALDVLCLARLLAVKFVFHDDAARLVDGFRVAIDKKRPVSWKQRTGLYGLFYRYRVQIADVKLVARVMIAKAEADPLAELESRHRSRSPSIRAWAAPNPFGRDGALQ